MKAKTYSALQKSYDQSCLTCSTALYYESLNNETEALRSWRECLSQLSAYTSLSHPSRSKTESEKTLLRSLKTMREQCQDRISLLQAIVDSKREAGVLGEDCASILPPLTPPLVPLGNGGPSGNGAAAARSPSPGRGSKRGLLATLRPQKKVNRDSQGSFDTLRRSGRGPMAATQAATMAWSSISRKEGENLAQSLSVPSLDPPLAQPGPAASSSTSNLVDEERRRPSFSGSYREKERVEPARIRPKARPHSSIFPLRSPTQAEFELEDSPPSPPPSPPPHKVPVRSIGAPSQPRHEVSEGDSNWLPSVPPKVPPKPASKPEKLKETGRRSEESYRSVSPGPALRNERASVGQPEDCHESDSSRPPTANSAEEWQERVEAAIKSIGSAADVEAMKQVANEIVVKGDKVFWDDIAGLEVAKQALKEAVVYPFLRPDLFSGLREPAQGVLLFGPPGTGKTMLARAVATESRSTFFSISASSLTSKYLGESEKLVRALFALAKALAPSIIFVDEIDSLLSSRTSSGENESSRRIKTEFLIQWSSLARAAAGRDSSPSSSSSGDVNRVLVLAATNLPWCIDEAARRRFARRQYIPLPGAETRWKQLMGLLAAQNHVLGEEDLEWLVGKMDGFSGSDITALAKDAAMGPLRSLGERLLSVGREEVRGIEIADFERSLTIIRPSVSREGLAEFEEWAGKFGERGG